MSRPATRRRPWLVSLAFAAFFALFGALLTALGQPNGRFLAMSGALEPVIADLDNPPEAMRVVHWARRRARVRSCTVPDREPQMSLMIFYGSIISGSLAIHRIGVQLQGVSALVLLLPLSGVWPTTGSATRSPNER